jgi:hypothetical protein
MKLTTKITASLVPAIALAASLFLGSCAETDVVVQGAASSFDALVKKLGTQVSWNQIDQALELDSPAGDAFKVSGDFSRNNDDGMTPDLELAFSSAPFLAAGLDPAKLVSSQEITYQIEDGMFMLHFEWSGEALKPLAGADGKPLAAPGTDQPAAGMVYAFKQLAAGWRDRIGYHEKLDHYGIALGGGNMVEWAKDLATNDKDLVFILNPEPLLAAGLDPAKLAKAGWILAKVDTRDAQGKAIQVERLLKPFGL